MFAAWWLVTLLLPALATAQETPSYLKVRNQLGMLAAQARSAGFPAAEYARRLGSLGPRIVEVATQLRTRPVDAADFAQAVQSLSPKALARPDLEAAWAATLSENPGLAALAEPQRFATTMAPDRERMLIKELVTIVRSGETALPGLPYAQYQRMNDTEVVPRLTQLHLSALARLRALPADAAGDAPAFESIDESAGGAAFQLAYRWLAIPRMRKTKLSVGARIDLFKQDGRTAESQGWDFYAQHLRRGAGDIFDSLLPQIAGRIDRGLPASARIRLAQAPTEVAVSVDAAALPARRQTTTRTVIVFGTPGQIAAAQMGANLGAVVGAFAEVFAVFQRSIDYSVDLDNRLYDGRQAFWRCHYTDCANYADLFMAHSRHLIEKDMQHLGINGIGSHDVDGGPVFGCDAQLAALDKQAKADSRLRRRQSDPRGWSGAVTQLLQSPAYAAYQACRDLKDVALRPRSSFF